MNSWFEKKEKKEKKKGIGVTTAREEGTYGLQKNEERGGDSC